MSRFPSPPLDREPFDTLPGRSATGRNGETHHRAVHDAVLAGHAIQRALPPSGIIVLVGLMGAGKTTIGRKLAARLGLPFMDADHEIERAAGCTISEIFERHGEAAFRDGERRVIERLLKGPPMILATGGGAFMDMRTRALIRNRSRSVWLRCSLPVLVRRLAGRTGRPLLAQGDLEATLEALQIVRHPLYAEADIIVDCGDDSVESGAKRVIEALETYDAPIHVPVELHNHRYDVMIGSGVLTRAGALISDIIPQKRVVVITDARVAALHLPRLLEALAITGIEATPFVVPGGEESKSLTQYATLANDILASGIERRTTVIGFGGGVVGDLAGFVAATILRGVPFIQIPTTLLSQVDSSVGGKTGLNARVGKNLIGAFYQPQIVLADISTLATLPRRERIAGYAEIVKAGIISGPDLFAWCESNASDVLDGDPTALAEAVRRACIFKAAVVSADEKEQTPQGGRALLNLGHSFAHALEASFGYDGRLLHGEAVSIGLHLAAALSARLGYCDATIVTRIDSHLRAHGMPAGLDWFQTRLSARELIDHMAHDKKIQNGRLAFVLLHDIGKAFTTRDVPLDAVRELLMLEGCTP